jgi:radical SAM superfamily enzyme YgiQ (UPF0313 family)
MKKDIDLLLVNPSNRRVAYQRLGSLSTAGIDPPVELGLFAGFIREKGFGVRILDADIEGLGPDKTAEEIIKFDPLLVCLSTGNPNTGDVVKMGPVEKILSILKEKAPYIMSIVEGPYPSVAPERVLKETDVDFVLRGEAFYPLVDLLRELKEGVKDFKALGISYMRDWKIISNPHPPLVEDLDSLPSPAWDLLPMERYRAYPWQCFGDFSKRQPYAAIYTSFGCPFNCKFCCVNATFGKPNFRLRSPKKVIEEIDYLVKRFKIRSLRILDNTFTLDKRHVKEICRLLIERDYKLNLWSYGRIETVDEELLKIMKKAGFNWICYGIESGSRRIREGVLKGTPQEKIEKAIEATRSCGINIIANFIFGLPEEDYSTMQETLNMAKEYLFEYVNFYVAMAYPGTRLYEEALQQGVELPDRWEGFSQYSEYTLPLSTKYLTSAEILRFRDNAFVEYFNNSEYIKMMEKKFGPQAAEYIKSLLKRRIKRRYA